MRKMNRNMPHIKHNDSISPREQIVNTTAEKSKKMRIRKVYREEERHIPCRFCQNRYVSVKARNHHEKAKHPGQQAPIHYHRMPHQLTPKAPSHTMSEHVHEHNEQDPPYRHPMPEKSYEHPDDHNEYMTMYNEEEHYPPVMKKKQQNTMVWVVQRGESQADRTEGLFRAFKAWNKDEYFEEYVPLEYSRTRIYP